MPPEITGAESEQTRLSRALVLIIEEQADGFFLYRYTTGAAFAGDTWHLTLDEAKEQAVFEYGDALGGWNSVPESSEDAVKYALHEAGIE